MRRLAHAAAGLALLAGACQRPAMPPVQPIVPAMPANEQAQRSLTPSDAIVEARRAIEDRITRRERLMREIVQPGSLWNTLRVEQSDIDRGRVTLPALIDIGRELFQIDFTPAQGLGNGLAARKSPLAGVRPIPNLRHVHYREFGGPDATRCVGCHHVGGTGGGGFTSDNVFLDGDGSEPATGLARTPRPLLGAALLQKLGEEMTEELRAQIASAQRSLARGTSAPVVVKGVTFGTLRVTGDGRLDLTGLRGVSLDLVVRPFGWKGTATSLRQLVVESLQQDLGVQAEELVRRAAGRPELVGDGPPDDPDADGVTREATEGMVTALTAYLAALPPPIEDMPEDPSYVMRVGHGAEVFVKLGCASCHVPELPLRGTVLGLGPTPASRPRVDLAPLLSAPGRSGRLPTVRAYTDLRRHDMGEELAEPRGYRGIPVRQWMTPPLWGVGSSAPYMHDGRAGSLHDAILAHGGEAKAARDTYANLQLEDGGALRIFLQSLTRPQHLEFKP